jgi:predicted DNA-binding protein with PD1-like motif
MTVARADGSCLGGHVLEGCIVFSTAEVVLVSLQRTVFTRSLDPSTGYHELMISTS